MAESFIFQRGSLPIIYAINNCQSVRWTTDEALMYAAMKKNEESVDPIPHSMPCSYRIPYVSRVRIILAVQSIFLARNACRVALYAIDIPRTPRPACVWKRAKFLTRLYIPWHGKLGKFSEPPRDDKSTFHARREDGNVSRRWKI